MPKQFLKYQNFGKGINNVKNPRDLAEGEVAECVNWSVSKNGELVPRSEWKTSTNGTAVTLSSNTIPSQTASVNPGYGLFYFEGDNYTGARGTNPTANGDIGTINDGPDGSGKYTICFYDNNKIFINDDNFWRDVAKFYPNPFSYGDLPFQIKVSEADESANNGIFTVVDVLSLASSATITVEANILTMGDAMAESVLVIAGGSFTDENVADGVRPFFQSVGYVENSLLALGNADDGKVDVFIDSEDAYTSDAITVLNNADTNQLTEFTYYYSDGALRVADANFRNESTPKWYGHISRNHLGTGDNVDYRHTVSAGFYEENNDLAAPTSANYTGSGSVNGSNEFPSTGAGWGLSVAEDSEDGDWDADTYKFACSFIYDENQESLLKEMDATQALAGDKTLLVNVYAYDDGTTHYGNRISGGRIYIKKSDTSVATGTAEPWSLLADIDIARGVRTSLDADYSLWTTHGTGQYRVTSDSTAGNYDTSYWVLKIPGPNLETYEILNGFPADTKQIAFGHRGCGFKTGVVSGNRAFVANVLYDDGSISSNEPGSNTEFKHFGDRIMFSQINKYDTFPNFNYIDVVKGDGEDYVKLSSYGDRLLAFKQRTLQILNIANPSPSGWFLEKIVPYAGVKNPYSVCETEYGVVWANENGAYLFDGNSVANLIEDKIADDGSTALSGKDWDTFWKNGVTSVDSIAVGYIPKLKQAIFIDKVSDAAVEAENAYYYDLRYKSWYFGKDAAPNANNDGVTNGGSFTPLVTNMVNTSDGRLLIAYDVQSTDLGGNGTGKVHITEHQTSEQPHKYYRLETPDFDFGDSGRSKKVYSIYIHYRHSGSTSINDSEVEYMTDQSGTWVSFDVGSQVISQTSGASNNYSVVKLDLGTGGNASPVSCQSIRFRFNFDSLNEDSKFSINDITIEYRILHKRVA